jgi:CHRD domain
MTRPRTTALFAVIGAALLVVTSISIVGAASQRAYVDRLTLTGDQEVIGTSCAPPTVCGDPDAVGHARIQIVPAQDRVCFRLDWSGIDGTVWGAHIHGPATRSQAAGIVVPLFMRDPTMPATHFAGTDATSGCVHDPDSDVIAANPSMYYVNVHSTVFGPGAIRAQLH